MYKKNIHANSYTTTYTDTLVPHFRHLSVQEADHQFGRETARGGSAATPTSRKSTSSITDLSGPGSGSAIGHTSGSSYAMASSRTSGMPSSRKTSQVQSRAKNKLSTGAERGAAAGHQSSTNDPPSRKFSIFSRENTTTKFTKPSGQLAPLSSRKNSLFNNSTNTLTRQRTLLQITGAREHTQIMYTPRAPPNRPDYRIQPSARQPEQRLYNGRPEDNSRTSSFSSRYKRDASENEEDDELWALTREKRSIIEAWLQRGDEESRWAHGSREGSPFEFGAEEEEATGAFLRQDSLPSIPDSPSELQLRDTAIHVVYRGRDSR